MRAAESQSTQELIVERRALLAEKVKEKAARLNTVEALLKDVIDDTGGPVVDEGLGIELDYERKQRRDWDLVRLGKVLTPDDLAFVVKTTVVTSRMEEVVKSGRVTERRLAPCYEVAILRGPIKETPLARSSRAERQRPRTAHRREA